MLPLRYGMLIFLTLFLMANPSNAGRIFTNHDLDKYEGAPASGERTFFKKNIDEKEVSIEKWCKKWKRYQNDLEKAQKELAYTKSELERLHISWTYAEQAVDKYRRAEMAVEDIKEDIKVLEDKAWRKDGLKLSYECDDDEYDE